MNYAVGSLVKVRGREWVVLPESEADLLVVRPLGGTDEEVTGIYLPLEPVEPAQFDLPDPRHWGDHRSCSLLRDAVRFGFRASTGPFRSFAHLAFEPRPYQLVPLLMALRLDPVRLLIADDVGIGKTIEAGLIARELLDRREVRRLAVLCPPHLAEQWQAELREKFHIEAELVLSSTVTQLERRLPGRDISLFEYYPFVIVSLDFIKADRRRNEFLRTCPELVIVDEAHTCAFPGHERSARHQRYQLVAGLAADPRRHLILVTATPHSGKEEAFRSLLGFLKEEFKELPQDLSGRENERHRVRLAAHFVQRRRADIRSYLQSETPFPERDERLESYRLSAAYRHLMQQALSYASEVVRDPSGGQTRRRVRWWSALALLRSLASSPAAAAATLRSRAQVAGAESVEEADQIGRQAMFDLLDSDATESLDVVPGSDFEEEQEAVVDVSEERRVRRRLLAMAREAEAITFEQDTKLQKAIALVKGLLQEGYQPIVFCRFIPTAEYVAQGLRQRLPKEVEVAAITGLLPPAERENRVLQLAQHERRVLVCTDCLSEGINLQEYFNAVLHYDLSWNPTRHEQREGRVDRFGQASPRVKVVTFFGEDNQIDGVVLSVLIKKHREIRSRLGIAIPVPLDAEQVIEAIFEGLLLRESLSGGHEGQLLLPGFEDVLQGEQKNLHREWEAASDRERRSRTLFAQHSIKVEEVARELQEVRAAIGLSEDVERFTTEVLRAYGALIKRPSAARDVLEVDLRETPMALRDAINLPRYATSDSQSLRVSFRRMGLPRTLYLSRTHPLVEGLAAYVLDTALDPVDDVLNPRIARRCGVFRTSRVERRTTLLLVRLRFHLRAATRGKEEALLAEECQLYAFRGAPAQAVWLEDAAEVEALAQAPAEANLAPEQITDFLQRVIDEYPQHLLPYLEEQARRRAEVLRESHRRVRQVASLSLRQLAVEPLLPPDVLGIYVYLPLPIH
ncbi:MAG: DEAD/DEAH box helicase [Thermogemmatispora sp.]|uniref:helicase-related protein n=1 Tax=Thermogemmatispora sp. TaxID=1968838 RepID=UPI002631A154|nr:helicase-related protein [Thermogemmatispora sp.]MBX5458137.1 DEAD/DEAH box helicase [Thermogemmatispora sp.]